VQGFRPLSDTRMDLWLGAAKADFLREQYRNWYGPPVNIRDMPGSVWIAAGGHFVGRFEGGYFASAYDALNDHMRRLARALSVPQYGFCNAGFSSISDALARASSGDGQMLHGGQVSKSGPTGVSAVASTLWRLGTMPAAGAAGSAAPGGRAPDKSTTGAMVFNNPSSGTLHLTGADASASVINNALCLYDRIFDVAKTMNSAATEAVTGVPTRYQSNTATAEDYAGGNFLFIEVGGTALAATAHNWTTCLYRNQAGTDNQTLPSVTGASGAIVDRFDMPVNSWFCPLATGDVGVQDLAQMQCSAVVATGAINFVIGRQIGILAFPIINIPLPWDWLTNRRQAPRIFADACLALFEFPKPATTATTYSASLYATRAPP
jgi:hypothetical protein